MTDIERDYQFSDSAMELQAHPEVTTLIVTRINPKCKHVFASKKKKTIDGTFCRLLNIEHTSWSNAQE